MVERPNGSGVDGDTHWMAARLGVAVRIGVVKAVRVKTLAPVGSIPACRSASSRDARVRGA